MIAAQNQLDLLWSKIDRIESMLSRALDNEEEKLRDVKWAANYCDVHPETIKRWIRERCFPVYKPDGRASELKFRKCEVDRWIKDYCK